MFSEILDKQIEKNGGIIAVCVGPKLDYTWILHSNNKMSRLDYSSGIGWVLLKEWLGDAGAVTTWMISDCKTIFNIENAPTNMMIDFLIEEMTKQELSNVP